MSELITKDPYLESAIREADPGFDVPIAFDGELGLTVREAVPQLIEIVTEDGSTVRDPEPRAVAAIHFTPGTSLTDTSRRAEILYAGIKSLQEYVAMVDSGKIRKPFALRGITTKDMGDVAKRIGFKPVRKVPKESSYELEKDVVVALYDDVVEAVRRLLERETGSKKLSLIAKLGERASRSAARS